MAIVAVWDFPEASPEQYEKVFEVAGTSIYEQPERLSHVCFRTPNGIRVVDVWRDEAALLAFGAVLAPAVTAVGLAAPPEIFPVLGFMGTDGVRDP